MGFQLAGTQIAEIQGVVMTLIPPWAGQLLTLQLLTPQYAGRQISEDAKGEASDIGPL
jgi:hypothetical protein